jgi:hypothetical protein
VVCFLRLNVLAQVRLEKQLELTERRKKVSLALAGQMKPCKQIAVVNEEFLPQFGEDSVLFRRKFLVLDGNLIAFEHLLGFRVSGLRFKYVNGASRKMYCKF